jgi:hypothetical protein
MEALKVWRKRVLEAVVLNSRAKLTKPDKRINVPSTRSSPGRIFNFWRIATWGFFIWQRSSHCPPSLRRLGFDIPKYQAFLPPYALLGIGFVLWSVSVFLHCRHILNGHLRNQVAAGPNRVHARLFCLANGMPYCSLISLP